MMAMIPKRKINQNLTTAIKDVTTRRYQTFKFHQHQIILLRQHTYLLKEITDWNNSKSKSVICDMAGENTQQISDDFFEAQENTVFLIHLD